MSKLSNDPEVVHGWFEKYSDEYMKFERIDPSERLHPAPELCAMLYISERSCEIHRFEMQAEHDELFLQGLDRMGAGITEEDVIYLRRCGVHWDDTCECFSLFT